MTKNRNIAPEIAELQHIELLQPEIVYSKSGLPIHCMRNLPNDVFHVQIDFGSGKIQQDKPLQSAFTADLLFSGTSNKSQHEIQELLDLQGAFANMDSAVSSTILNVYGLVQKFETVLDIVLDVLENAAFPEEVFELHRKSSMQKHRINMDKNSYVARREFLQALFPNHAIGKVANEPDFEHITRQDCVEFYQQHLAKNIQQIQVVGAVSDAQLDYLKTHFDQRFNPTKSTYDTPQMESPVNLYLEKTNALQSTIRIGKIMFTPEHPDYFEFDILETILGGYFGSRLMQNLREDKGYTYGIGSGLTIHEKVGYFFISTEVGKEHKDAALDAIRFEIDRLRNELISPEELALAKAYIQGQILKSTDGAFAQMNQFLFTKRFNLPENHLNTFLETLANISPERLRDLAQKYLDWDSMVKVVVG